MKELEGGEGGGPKSKREGGREEGGGEMMARGKPRGNLTTGCVTTQCKLWLTTDSSNDMVGLVGLEQPSGAM